MKLDETVLQVVKIYNVPTLVVLYPPKLICFCSVENYGLVLSSVMVQQRVDLYQINLSGLLKYESMYAYRIMLTWS
jgi:hypothetical protein